MNSYGNYPPQYLLFNAQTSKNLAVVMQIEDVVDLYGIADTFTQVRYGDANLVYGLPGLVYGGLRKVSTIRSYMMLDASMTIGQRIEPESGKGNIGTLNITLIDKNGEISKLVAPGIVVDEILYNKQVTIRLGFTQTSYPEDYLILYRGYFTSIDCPPGVVKFQISDTTSKKRRPICNTPITRTTDVVNDTQLTIPSLTTLGFYQPILGPDGNYDPTVGTFIQIDEEIMSYPPTGLGGNVFNLTARGQLGSLATEHENDAAISNSIQFGTVLGVGINALELMLKIYLSGWNGPCETNIPIDSFAGSDVGFNPHAFVFGVQSERPVNAIIDLGLSVGDYFSITNATDPANNLSGIITGFQRGIVDNQIILTDQTFVSETSSGAFASFRSQFDTLPVDAGLKLRMRDVDVETILYIKNTYFTASGTSNIRLYVNGPAFGKDLIDSQICLPLGLYSISRFGRVSLSITKPPLPGVGKLVQVDWNSVIDPDKIHVTRSTNNRGFYNVISYQYDKSVTTGAYASVSYFLDTNSLNLFGDMIVQLPITADALYSDLGGPTIAQNRGRALLTRYKNCVIIIELTVNWTVGSLIEVSDIVLLVDNGKLQIMNFETGERNLGTQLFEVIDRQYNIFAGNVKLKLMGGLGFNIDSRFALYSPSSQCNSGSTNSLVRIKPSYGQTSLAAELQKWAPFLGLPVQVHSYDWSQLGTSILVGVGDNDPSALTLDPPLGFVPAEDFIVDIAPYPTDEDKATDSLYKTLYTHWSPSLPVVSGVSETEFNVSLGSASIMTVGNAVILRNPDYSIVSPEIKVASIVGTLVTLEDELGFTPDNTYTVEGIGFKDGTGFYRWT